MDAVSATLAALEAAFLASVTSDARATVARRALTGALARTVRAVVLATANIFLFRWIDARRGVGASSDGAADPSSIVFPWRAIREIRGRQALSFRCQLAHHLGRVCFQPPKRELIFVDRRSGIPFHG